MNVRCIHGRIINGEDCDECPPGRRALSFPEATVGKPESDWVLLVSLLAQVYDDEGIASWLQGEHVNFGNQTVFQMIAQGKMADVLADAERMARG